MIPRKPLGVVFSAALLTAALSGAFALRPLKAEPTSSDAAPPAETNGAISPRDEADSLHFVIAADREMLCRQYLKHRPPSAGTRGGADDDWPCPSLALREACESIQIQGAEFSYALRALHPKGTRNGPQTELEQTGLAFVEANPGHNYYGKEMLGGRPYFTAVYPDLPPATSCVDCHSQNSGTASRPHKAGESLGGLVVRVPLEF